MTAALRSAAPVAPAAIERLKAHGMKVTIANILMRQNVPDYDGVHALARDLGVNILWTMPIHPIGQVIRKGTLGSPY